MEDKLKYKDTVKEAIVIALIELMKTQDLNRITIQEITTRAGVGRSSFYRNFSSKEDILLFYIDYLLQVPKKNRPYAKENLRDYVISHFRMVKRNRSFFLVLRRQNLLHLLYRQTYLDVKQSVALYDLYRNSYQAAFFSGAGVSVLIQWVENGFLESEEEMADMFIYLMDGHHREEKNRDALL